MLHGIEEGVECGDTLSPDGASLPKADLILTNPPFGTRKAAAARTERIFDHRRHVQ
jgi:type I restriction enzyme M protein